MAEKFDLKTAAGLIPQMDGSESTTKQLIDAIGLYDSLLDNDGKKLLTNYILKLKLSESAKIRLKQTYASNQLLIADLRSHFIATKSISALSVQLNNAKQHSLSIDQFGRSLEEMLVDLTLTQADGNEGHVNILRGVNEKIAINSFANGLNNPNLKTIIKARNYSSLNDAIRGAKDEELAVGNPKPIFHINTHYNRGRGKNRYNQYKAGRVETPPSQRYNSNYNNNFRGSYYSRGRSNNRPQNSNFGNRTHFNSSNNARGRSNYRNYFINENNSNSNNTNSKESEQNKLFFRDRT